MEANASAFLNEVAAALGMDEKTRNRGDFHCFAKVVSVNSDGSYQIRLNASSTTTRAAACCEAMKGDRVLALIMRSGRCVAIAKVVGTA